MIYELGSRSLMAVAKLLPPPAMLEFVKAANAAAGDGGDHNACVKAGWVEVNKGWERKGRQYARKRGPRSTVREQAAQGARDLSVTLRALGPDTEVTIRAAEADGRKTLYVNRPLLNGDELRAWAASQGFESALPAGEMHVTIAFSKEPVDWSAFEPGAEDLTVEGGEREVHQFPARLTANGATVLLFDAPALKGRWQEFQDGGATWDFPEYRSHITITYAAAPEDLDGIEPYDGPLVFGPEKFAEIRQDLAAAGNGGDKVEFEEEPLTQTNKAGARHSRADQTLIQAAHDSIVKAGATCSGAGDGEIAKIKAGDILKIDEEQRMVYGWASVISIKGEPVVDLQDDVIPADELEKAATEFMLDVRHAMAMHERNDKNEIEPTMIKGVVVHSFPLTAEHMKALGINCEREGWIVGVKVLDDATWARVKSGELKAFSWGGTSLRD